MASGCAGGNLQSAIALWPAANNVTVLYYTRGLALLGLLPLMWAFTLLTPGSRPGASARLLVRTLVLAALALALAGAQLVQSARSLTTVFLVDASTDRAGAARAPHNIDALRAMPASDRAAVVVFGQNALVGAPRPVLCPNRLNSRAGGDPHQYPGCHPAWLALLPADTEKRIVLPGWRPEQRQRSRAARLARTRGPIDTVALLGERGPM
jgi:hypothetical protein